MRPDASAPSDLRELGYGEHLLVWSFRAVATGRWGCRLIAREYDAAFGPMAELARRGVEVFAGEIERQGRRRVTLGRPSLLCMTRDEQLLLAIYRAAQRCDEDRCAAHLTWLLGCPAGPPFYAAARATAGALALRGHELSPPVGGASASDPVA